MTVPEPSAVWDPDPLAVGDRVRVRLGGECRLYRHDDPDFLLPRAETGTVCLLLPEKGAHPYGVELDDMAGKNWLNLFARVELERLP